GRSIAVRAVNRLSDRPIVSARNRSCEPLGLPQLQRKELIMSAKLFVGNLSFDTTGDEISELFSQVGQVESCQLITDRDTGRSKGFAFVEMQSKAEATTAKEKFNGQDLHGRALKIDEAKPKADSGSNGGYRGSRRY